MVYHKAMLGPSEGQQADLMSGVAIRLSPEHFEGDFPIYLTGTQMKKLSAGKAFNLKLSPAQVKYNAKKGGSIFGDAGRWLGHKGVDLLIDHTGLGFAGARGKQTEEIGFAPPMASNAQIHQMVDHALQSRAGRGFLSDTLSSIGLGVSGKGKKNGTGIISDGAKWLGHKGVEYLGDKMNQKGLGAKKGKGFISDGAKWLGHKGVDMLADRIGFGAGPPIDSSPINPTHAFLGVKKKSGTGLYL